MAKSRRPFRVRRSHDARRLRTSAGSSPFGSPASRHPATDGTAAASGRSIAPSTCRKPSSDRSAVTVSFAAPRALMRAAGHHEGGDVGQRSGLPEVQIEAVG